MQRDLPVFVHCHQSPIGLCCGLSARHPKWRAMKSARSTPNGLRDGGWLRCHRRRSSVCDFNDGRHDLCQAKRLGPGFRFLMHFFYMIICVYLLCLDGGPVIGPVCCGTHLISLFWLRDYMNLHCSIAIIF